MRTTTSTTSLLLIAAAGLAASMQFSAAKAGGLYVNVGVPVAIAAPVTVVAPPVAIAPPVVTTPVLVTPAITDSDIAQVAVEFDPTVVVASGYCCGPGWRGAGWHDYGYGHGDYRGYGNYRGYSNSRDSRERAPVAHFGGHDRRR
jgi:hypothetical protein